MPELIPAQMKGLGKSHRQRDEDDQSEIAKGETKGQAETRQNTRLAKPEHHPHCPLRSEIGMGIAGTDEK
ncbi:hypothetical protein BN874_770017 [Candidatus Contendobacter odensis Run_B_J11]|uniref:Uncharacterized protein n=1 Tax=Candidatus Contendobacter odensis Run_B_J11 TaxID=1400861 RepID=A0A7U7J5S9_9GAMM|nr:hypothetical protein BN874_770017 [Candidatus Contendobacter odensis Run_B_J11]